MTRINETSSLAQASTLNTKEGISKPLPTKQQRIAEIVRTLETKYPGLDKEDVKTFAGAFVNGDRNGDNKVSLKEWKNNIGGSEGRFAEYDKDKSGNLSVDEIRYMCEFMQDESNFK
jgi:EF hand